MPRNDRKHRMGYVALALVLGLATTGWAGLVTGFETTDDPGYVSGNTYIGVDGWVMHTPAGPVAGEMVTTNTLVAGGAQAGVIDAATCAVNRAFNVFTPITDSLVHCEVSLAMTRDGSETPMAYFYIGEDSMYYSYNPGKYTAAQVGFSGTDISIRNGGSYVSAGTYTFGEYYTFSMDIDMIAGTYDVTITGDGINTTLTDMGFRGTLTDVDAISGVCFLNTVIGTQSYMDDVVIPEPATLVLLGVGGLGFCARKRK
ncbi:MAG: PEP-CTERM sorting domain-containing protein [Phycisphaerae bacterium]|nr:PEP-CTERM sorting domain-containing protein [Phycisphaerae bacterium]